MSTMIAVTARRAGARANMLRDARTMLRRDVLHSMRYPLLTISGMTVPILMMLLFAGVFGSALRSGVGAASGHVPYIEYLTPGILMMTVGAAAAGTAINVCTDMSEGIIARFRTMAIARTSVLTGQVLGSLIRTVVSGTLVILVALGLGFRPRATPIAWLGAVGVFTMLTLALTWLTIGFGLVAKTPAGANSLSLIPQFLAFISSAFVPPASMPPGVRWFAQNQPFTPIIDTMRGLLTGTSIGGSALLSVLWCAVVGAGGYLLARAMYDRDPAR